MASVGLPKFRLCRTFTLGEEGFDTDFISDLISRGFRCDAVAKAESNGQPRKKVRRKRRKTRVSLTKERIREFQKHRADGKSYRRIGQIMGVSDGRAWQIVNQEK
jgi:hypothetical protein